jgi:hypothetical protein
LLQVHVYTMVPSFCARLAELQQTTAAALAMACVAAQQLVTRGLSVAQSSPAATF